MGLGVNFRHEQLNIDVLLPICISKGNTKIGSIPNVSLPAVKACRPDAPCKSLCYANKGTSRFPSARDAWERNYVWATKHRGEYFKEISLYVTKHVPNRFRWHVSGDILDQNYLECMNFVAVCNPNTKFLVFTKMYELDYGAVPNNLQIVFSAWPSYPITSKNGFRIAWMQDGTEDRIPVNAFECPGKCSTCHTCWDLKKLGHDVVFHKH